MAGTLESLLHFEGTNGSQTFTDSTGKHSWVSYALAAGPAVDTSQAKFGSSALTMPAVSNISVICTSGLTWGTGPFTIDFWVKLNGTQPGQQNLFDIANPGGIIYIPNAGGPLYFYVSAVQIQGTTAVTTDVWHHVALTFDGAKTYLFLDGHLEGAPWANAAPNYSSPTNYPQIRQAGGTCPIAWYDEVRISLGAADWPGFTPPTAPYSGPAETLLHFDGTNGSTSIIDATGNHTWTANGGTQLLTANSKFGPSSIGASWITGDGTIVFGTGDFTVDCWFYPGPSQAGIQGHLFAFAASGLGIIYYNGTNICWFYGSDRIVTAGTLATNTWHHVALTKQGSTHCLFVDGILSGTWVSATNYGTSAAGYPLIQSNSLYLQAGSYQDELRILVGTAAWGVNFTPPTAPYADPVTAYTLTATLGTFALTGIAPNTLYGRVLPQSTVGNFTLTGIAAGSISSYVMPLVPGSFVFTGIAAGTLVGHALPSALGTFAFTGITANLIYSAGLNSYVMSATPAAFVFTGIAANLVYYQLVNYVLVCGTGQFYFTGLGVGSPGQGLLSGSGLGTPVVTIPFGGAPVIDVTYLGLKAGAPVSEAAPGEGTPVTKVTTGGTPVVYI